MDTYCLLYRCHLPATGLSCANSRSNQDRPAQRRILFNTGQCKGPPRGLYIFGLCIVSLSKIAYADGELGAGEMMLMTMPWYLPLLIIISLYIIPFNRFKA